VKEDYYRQKFENIRGKKSRHWIRFWKEEKLEEAIFAPKEIGYREW
jgi:hypothetical protein